MFNSSISSLSYQTAKYNLIFTLTAGAANMSTKNIDILPIYRSFSYCMWLENAYNGEKNKICKKQKGLYFLCFLFRTKHYNIQFSLHILSDRQMHTHSESRNVNKHLLPTQSNEEKQQKKS